MICENTKSAELIEAQDAINKRFFIAVEEIVNGGDFRSLSEFCTKNGLNRIRYWELSLRYGVKGSLGIFSRYKAVETSALSLLASRFNYSPSWLLLGVGPKKS